MFIVRSCRERGEEWGGILSPDYYSKCCIVQMADDENEHLSPRYNKNNVNWSVRKWRLRNSVHSPKTSIYACVCVCVFSHGRERIGHAQLVVAAVGVLPASVRFFFCFFFFLFWGERREVGGRCWTDLCFGYITSRRESFVRLLSF